MSAASTSLNTATNRLVTALRRPSPRSVEALVAPALAVAAGCLAAAFVYVADPTRPGGIPGVVCPSKALFGITCPLCGGTRMVYSLMRLDLTAAVHYNAVVLAASPLFVWLFVAWTVGRWRGSRPRTWVHWRGAPWVVGVVLAVWAVLRNLPFVPFTALHV